eukprot:TRINITY_DN8923_c0_g1_i1.p1 TRINITY_DN8923_c0_g1~~TRINITY_DN8923_c0_g1_i1.p1  ORF type:complete len:175 (+),score=35.49 TRINITY_DN8923_c0_g1_i1:37-561(+)
MGCNGSKAKTIEESRKEERARVPEPKSSGTSSRTSPTSVQSITPTKNKSQGDDKLSKSYSDAREGQSDFLKNIVERTAHDLIDVSDISGGNLKESDVGQRKQSYIKLVESSLPRVKSFWSLPICSANNQNPAISLAADIKDMKDWRGAEAIDKAYTTMTIRDVGMLVVPFGSQT